VADDDDVENIKLPGAFLRYEVWQRAVGARQHRLEVDVDNTHGSFIGHVLEPAGFTDAGVVPYHVESAVRVAGAEVGKRGIERGLVSEVDRPLAWKSFAPSRPIPLAGPVMKIDFVADIGSLPRLTMHA
jgi:hypothetical protein